MPMDEYLRHKRTFAFFRWLLAPFLRLKFNFSYDDLSGIESPYLLLMNHNLDYDPMLVGIAAKNHLYFVASEHVTRAGIYSKLLMRYFKPIIHTKGKAGAQSSIEILRTLKKGRSVCLFPEGNRSFNGLTGSIPAATGKLARRSGAKLVTFRIQGGYFAQPRWGHGLRRGKLKGSLVNIYPVEKLKAMTDSQVYEAICADLFEDAYASQAENPVAFVGRNPAVGLETTLFTCPVCGKIGTLCGKGNTFTCSACGFAAEYTTHGFLRYSDGSEHSITELDRLQKTGLAAAVIENGSAEPLFSDMVTAERIGSNHEIEASKRGLLCGSSDGFEFDGQKIAISDIIGAAIHGRNTLVVHLGDNVVHYEIHGSDNFSALKYLYLYNILAANKDK